MVAPFAGAWIEIMFDYDKMCLGESLPSRERGLKYYFTLDGGNLTPSLPSRERGLKYQ